MKILHLLASPVFSGPAEPVALLAAAQRALGHDVSVAIDRKRTRHTSEELAMPRLQQDGLLDEGGLELSVKSNPLQVFRDVKNLRRRRLDVVHSHFTHDHLIARYGLPPGARLVRSFHAPRSVRGTPKANAVTVPYDGLLAEVASLPAMVLPALVDASFVPPIDRAAVRAKLQLLGSPVIGMVSTFQASRRHETAIDAFALLLRRLPGARLVLAGDGEQDVLIRNRVISLGVKDHVTFTGYLAADDFVPMVQSLDELWVLGLGNDYGARAAAQARACGVRVLAVDEGALSRYADVLVPPVPQAIADASGGEKLSKPLLPNEEIARRVLALYGQVVSQ